MLEEKKYEFLEELLSTPSPVGHEAEGQKIWLKETEAVADRIETDAYGSAAAFLDINPEAPTIMLEAHCDEIGMVVQHIDDSGFVYVSRLGGSDPAIARARRVNIHTRTGQVTGVIGHTAIHLQEKNGTNKAPAWKDLFVDLGVSNKEEALKLVQVGDPVTYVDQHEMINDDRLIGRALDNRIGGFIIAEALRVLAERRSSLQVNVAVLNSVQEEVGGFGARMMSYRLHPDAAIITDVTHATDSPGINQKEHGTVKLGEGPVVTHGAAAHPILTRKVEDIAGQKSIAIQHEAAGARTGTDTDSIFHQKTGIPCALISLPLRYMHSPVEMASITDVQNVIELMAESVMACTLDENFNVLNR